MTAEELASVTVAIGKMFCCFPQSAAVDPDGQLRGYVNAVNEELQFNRDLLPVDVIEACSQFSRGNVKDHSKGFCPSSAELCDQVRYQAKFRGVMARRADRLALVKT